MIVTKKSQVLKNSQPIFFPSVCAKVISNTGLGDFLEYTPETDHCTIRKNYGEYEYSPGASSPEIFQACKPYPAQATTLAGKNALIVYL